MLWTSYDDNLVLKFLSTEHQGNLELCKEVEKLLLIKAPGYSVDDSLEALLFKRKFFLE